MKTLKEKEEIAAANLAVEASEKWFTQKKTHFDESNTETF